MLGNYKQYKCIERLIIVVSRKLYLESGKSKEYRYCHIGSGYIIDFNNNIQFEAYNPTN